MTATRLRTYRWREVETGPIDSVAQRFFALHAAPGMGIVVVPRTQVIYQRGFGVANVEEQRPVTAETGSTSPR